MQEAMVQKGVSKAAAMIGERVGAAGARKLQRMNKQRSAWLLAVLLGAAAYYFSLELKKGT